MPTSFPRVLPSQTLKSSSKRNAASRKQPYLNVKQFNMKQPKAEDTETVLQQDEVFAKMHQRLSQKIQTQTFFKKRSFHHRLSHLEKTQPPIVNGNASGVMMKKQMSQVDESPRASSSVIDLFQLE